MWLLCEKSARLRAGQTARGFSLIELAMVMVILGTISAVTIASLGPTHSARTQAAARLLASKLNHQRSHAMATGVGTWISFDTTTSTCAFFTDSTSSPGWASAVPQLDPDRGGALLLTLGTGEWSGISILTVGIGGGGTTLGFDWMGRPINSAGTLLTTNAVVTFSGSETMTVRLGTGLATTP